MEILGIVQRITVRWKIVVAFIVLGGLAGFAFSALTTPLYRSSTSMFVATNAMGQSSSDIYAGNMSAQQLVSSLQLIATSDAVAQRTIDRLHLNETAAELSSHMTATTKTGTFLIDLAVSDTDKKRAADIANAASDEFVRMVADLAKTRSDLPPYARVVVTVQATPADSPYVPQTGTSITVGLLLGLLLGIGCATLLTFLDNTVKSRATAEDLTKATVVGVIPFDKELSDRATISFKDSKSHSAEAFRELRTNLRFLQVDNPPRMIVITSPVPNEGKTTTAINLSLVLAEAGHSVCLVEGDLRRPRLIKYMRMVAGVGLSNVLAGQVETHEVIQNSPYERLKVVAAGPLPPNPSELVGSESAARVLDELHTMFDYVIIDAPPLLPVTDGALLSRMADGVFLVLRHGKVKKVEVERAVGNVQGVGARLLGSIITMTPEYGGGDYYYHYYYYSEPAAPSGRDNSARHSNVSNARYRALDGPMAPVAPAPLPTSER